MRGVRTYATQEEADAAHQTKVRAWSRARNRALRELSQRHPDEFAELLSKYKADEPDLRLVPPLAEVKP